MPSAVNIVIKQLGNPTPSTASLQVSFTLTGILTDLVEIYAQGASDSTAALVQTVDIDPPEINYISDEIQLPAGTEFFFRLCPRDKTGDQLDDQLDGQAFETFCSEIIHFITQGTDQPSPPRPKPPPPSITTVDSIQATLSQPGQLVAHWSASTDFDQYHVIVRQLPAGLEREIEINTEGTTGFLVVTPVLPGQSWSFKVQGCDLNIIGSNDCSDFTPLTVTKVPPNTNSLRTFLRLSGVKLSPGLRSLGQAAISAGVRHMMGI